MSNVVLLSTRKLPPTYFDQVREDLGDQDITIDVVGWVAPSAWVADKVNTFTLIGPGRMPAAPVVEPEPETVTEPTDEAPDAVIAPEAVADPETVVEDEAEVAPAAAQVAAAASTPTPPATPPPAAKPRPTGAKRVVKAVEWRARKAKKVAGRMLPKAIKTSAPVKFLRGQRATSDLGKTYWERVLSRRDVLSTIDQADVVIALDAGAIWAGWNLGQRKASTPVVLGLPAARRELDMMKAPVGNG
ncbi:hypothetical protein EV649_6032 [Kribbella sp. VKM Ac-2569]|uniref:hypothetical protein n=1 Tax=Kribbella sp. VKM Ac-2569 TaxID=2512220 RepID=UPI00102B2A85|nr:hypothetical protein [Kribbella sp. VKM Ac-2569]RZT15244.1 hypothetical protein EV649_6032 [Kribbella sp. VKM Ac-2569]